MALKVLALGGDGIGPEVLDAALQVLDIAAKSVRLNLDLSEDLLHGAAWDQYGVFLKQETLDKAKQSDALLVGAVGGPNWDHIILPGGPEEQDGLMKLRYELDTFACIRHTRAWDALVDKTPFRPDVVHGSDIVVMRELCGGAMFTKTRGEEATADSGRRAFDLNEYTTAEIERFARVGFEVARRRKSKVLSVDKSNVFIAGGLWREVVDEIGKREFPDVELTHFYADNASYQMCCRPKDFDVVLADNLFGDLLSDQSAAIAGSLGMLPSACLSGLSADGLAQGAAIYEPVHGSAPDIEGQSIANPLGMILSTAIMLEYSAGETACAKKIEKAVNGALNAGFVTRDLGGSHTTQQMTDAVIKQFKSL